MKKLLYTLLLVLSSCCFALGTTPRELLYDHKRKMLKDTHVVTHELIPWSIDLIKDHIYHLQRWKAYGPFGIPGIDSWIYWDDGWVEVYDSDWDKAKNNSVEVD